MSWENSYIFHWRHGLLVISTTWWKQGEWILKYIFDKCVVFAKKEAVKKLYTGSPLFNGFLEEKTEAKEGNIAVFCGDKFIGVYGIGQEKEIFAKPEFVLN